MHLSISEIIGKCATMKTPDEKIAWLQKNANPALRNIIQVTYDKARIQWLLPDSAPPWTKNEYEDEAKTMLYKETRRFKIFIKGEGYDNLNQIKRESLFIQLLEDIDNEDAEMIVNHCLPQKPFKGLQKKTVMKAFPGLIQE